MTWDRRLDLHIDVDAPSGRNLLTSATDASVLSTPPELVAGDNLTVRIAFWRRGAVPGSLTAIDPGADSTFILSGRPQGVPSGSDVLFLATDFTEVMDDDQGTGIWETTLNLATQELADHLAASPEGAKTITAELEIRDAGDTSRRSLQFQARALPQVYENGNPPSSLPAVAVSYMSQTPSDAEKIIARGNIYAMALPKNGLYTVGDPVYEPENPVPFCVLTDYLSGAVIAPIADVEIRLGAASIGFWADVSLCNVLFDTAVVRIFGPTGTDIAVMGDHTYYSVERARLFRTTAGWMIREAMVSAADVVNAIDSMDSTQQAQVRGFLSLGSAALSNAEDFIPAGQASEFLSASQARIANEFVVDDGTGGYIVSQSYGPLLAGSVPFGITHAQLGEACSGITTDAGFFGSPIQSVSFPVGPIILEYAAFYWCYNLTRLGKIGIGSTIGTAVFEACPLDGIDFLPDDMVDVPANTFAYAGMLESPLSIPERITGIGAYAFNGAHWSQIVLHSDVSNIGDYAFSGSFIESMDFQGVYDLVGSGNGMCMNCPNLTSVSFSAPILSIPTEMFAYCPNLANVTIPEGVSAIGDSAFNACGCLGTIVLPSTIVTIGAQAFISTGYLSVNLYAMEAPAVQPDSFDWGGLDLHVPAGAIGYDSGEWVAAASISYDLTPIS